MAEESLIDNLFVCIGAQKAGTSWLHSVLSQDDRFACCPYVKEVHYFDFLYCSAPHLNNWRAFHLIKMIQRRGLDLQRILEGWLSGDEGNLLCDPKYQVNSAYRASRKFLHLSSAPNDSWYMNMLRPRGDQIYSMDITPDYAVIGDEGFKHMARISRNLKLLFILRHPSERAWSGVLQGKKKFPGGVSGFLDENYHRLDELFRLCTTGMDVEPRSNYLKTFKALERSSLLDKTLVKFYDDIAAKPDDLISDLYGFLELTVPAEKRFENVISERVYSTKGKRSMPPELRVRLDDYYEPMLKGLSEYVELPAGWLKNG